MDKVKEENLKTGQQETDEPWKKPDKSDRFIGDKGEFRGAASCAHAVGADDRNAGALA